MKKHKIKYSAVCMVLTGLLLYSCATTFRAMNPDYKGKKFPERTLSLFPINPEQVNLGIREHFIDDFKVELGSNYEKMLADTAGYFIHKTITGTASSKKVTVGEFITQRPNISKIEYFNFEKVHTQSMGDPIHIFVDVPKKEALERNNIKPDFLLVLSNLNFGTETSYHQGAPMAVQNPAGGTMMMGGGGSSSRSFDFMADYVIWDYQANEPVAWGRTIGSASANFYIARSDWLKNFRQMGQNIMYKSPFATPRVQ
jgi:hypothetical protein